MGLGDSKFLGVINIFFVVRLVVFFNDVLVILEL